MTARRRFLILVALSVLTFGFARPQAFALGQCENLWRSSEAPLFEKTLISKRLELKIIGPERTEDTFAIWNHPDVRDLFAPGRTISNGMVRMYLSEASSTIHYGVFRAGPFSAKNLIGTIILRPTVTALGHGDSRTDIALGIAIHPAFARQGIATEALARVIEHVMSQGRVETLNADIYAGNDASVAVFQKLGFYEGRSGDRNTRRFTLSKWGWKP